MTEYSIRNGTVPRTRLRLQFDPQAQKEQIVEMTYSTVSAPLPIRITATAVTAASSPTSPPPLLFLYYEYCHCH